MVVAACPPDSVKVGPTCVDKYEASVWQIDPSKTTLVNKVQAGTATLADLQSGGATQLSRAGSSTCAAPGFPANFPANGQWTPVSGSNPPSPGVYAVSISGVLPSGCVTFFRASQACRLSGKRLARNDEWQDAAAGTPNPGSTPGPNDCNTNSQAQTNTGSRANCKSNWGAFDMVGNEWERVAEWGDLAQHCTSWPAGFSGQSCVGGPGSSFSNLPGAWRRGGDALDGGSNTGVFTVDAGINASQSGNGIGFRCAR
jgi:formylglycine-generating enzyme required for sulfatase activity